MPGLVDPSGDAPGRGSSSQALSHQAGALKATVSPRVSCQVSQAIVLVCSRQWRSRSWLGDAWPWLESWVHCPRAVRPQARCLTSPHLSSLMCTRGEQALTSWGSYGDSLKLAGGRAGPGGQVELPERQPAVWWQFESQQLTLPGSAL